jgi:hypothetical protein
MANRSAPNFNRAPTKLRCAIYTRKSSEEGLEQDFNSLDAQREASEVIPARSAKGGRMSARCMTTEASRAQRLNGRLSSGSWRM